MEKKYYFAIHFNQILNRINDYENAYYETPKSKDRIYRVWSLILIPLCIAILIAYNIFASVSIIIFMVYGYCYVKFYQLWKLYGYSKRKFWLVTLVIFAACFAIAPYIRTVIMHGISAVFRY